MGFLSLTRHEGEEIRLTIDPGVDAEVLLRNLLRDGITIHVTEIQRGRVCVSIEAPPQVMILRTELVDSALATGLYK
ncbi:carbon storage regulator [Aquipseudomonas ullengensis]|uniref:Carbon storage regulator n=1 Tax=Aquipseudomonas ullengensis TaxID=2759166 RepID=A0A7W4LMN4_9GAMM|nr:carbon storage regulator [Pseudomonas ullengensis]